MKLDNIEFLNIENQTTNFPIHYHETFCITLIKSGIFHTTFNDKQSYSEIGTIAISHPFELHANPKLDKNNKVSFSTLYLPKDLLSYYFKKKPICFQNKIDNDTRLAEHFTFLENTLKMKCTISIESALKDFIKELLKHVIADTSDKITLNFGRFNEINHYIESNIKSRICLSEMAKMANLNRFSFIRSFKESSGMTPSQYVLMKKIFSSKDDFFNYDNFTDIAHDYNFTDLAHWSNTFKKYIGIAPSEFKKSHTF